MRTGIIIAVLILGMFIGMSLNLNVSGNDVIIVIEKEINVLTK